MYKTLLPIFGILLLLSTLAYPEGILFTPDRKSVVGKYTAIKLDEEQVTDVETKRIVYLYPEQEAKLEKIAGGPMGDVEVLTSRYTGCTCFATKTIAVWTRKGVLQFPHSLLITYSQQRELEDDMLSAEELNADESVVKIVIFDSRGEMYAERRHVNINQVKQIVDELNQVKPKETGKKIHRTLIFDVPPPINSKIDKKIESLVHEIDKYSMNMDISIVADGIDSAI